VKSWDEYILKHGEPNERKKFQKRPTEKKETPSGGLHSLLKDINLVPALQRKQRRNVGKPIYSPDNKVKGKSSPRSPNM